MNFIPMNFIRKNSVPLFFIALCGLGAYWSGMRVSFLLNEVITRLARNSFLVISLIIPVLAGMGLNFGIVLGAMSAQFAYIFVVNMELGGGAGVLATCVLSVPLSILFGWLTGILFNKAKGREMISGIILGFFANGLYQLVCLTLVGWIIPVRFTNMLLPDKSGTGVGVGLVNTIDLRSMQYSIDNLLKISITMQDVQNFCHKLGWDVTIAPSIPITIPIGTFVVIALLCAAMHFLFRTRLGQEFRASGQDRHIAEVAGIQVDRVRIAAIIFSTVLAGWGQIIFLQNMGNLQTYGSHVQVGTFAVASLLIGGASVARATVEQALLGTLLFHTLFVVSPLAGKNLMGNVQVGEYFRVFVSYGVIGIALALHAWEHKNKRDT